jgi:hypothetical protein
MPATPSVGPLLNKSVAIAVGARTYISGGLSATVANTTGFFVSDTGQNIAIGQYIDDTAAIGVSGAGSDYAIKAKGDVGITGDVEVIGDLGVTGDVGITGDLSVTGDVRIVDQGISSEGAVTISSGPTSGPVTVLTISPANYDRVIYLVSMNTFGTTQITGGAFTFEAKINSSSIFYTIRSSKQLTGAGLSDLTNAVGISNIIVNGNYILPAGLSSTIEVGKFSLTLFNTATSSPGPYIVDVKSHRIGKV